MSKRKTLVKKLNQLEKYKLRSPSKVDRNRIQKEIDRIKRDIFIRDNKLPWKQGEYPRFPK